MNGKNGNNGNNGRSRAKSKKKTSLPNLSPQEIAVIVGILTNALEVESVLVDRDQKVAIVLAGSLRRRTEADRLAEEIGNVSVGDLINALIRR
ncbi:hypothetical protein CHH75_01810 [Paenibacillus sp. 7541]|uniref:Uncharacterized protein n=1 Tax=Paenibacillus campinasensis TaxID=66347 RepID=A0A268EUR0_9BACL|nr:hypothetical protein [Paenibacillus campinasensis]PAD76866.1 hypothetical protein CHH67_11465 [Paenibacillus campinasensis]PAK55696.1 hypothetical protein CHH75_01810 [Paenibacillus sp. 7541]